jgi:hypothetical protein
LSMARADLNVVTSRQDRIACASSISPPGRRRRLPRHLGRRNFRSRATISDLAK